MNSVIAIAWCARGSVCNGRNQKTTGIIAVVRALQSLGAVLGRAMDPEGCEAIIAAGSAIGGFQVVILQHTPALLIHAAGFCASSGSKDSRACLRGKDRQL